MENPPKNFCQSFEKKAVQAATRKGLVKCILHFIPQMIVSEVAAKENEEGRYITRSLLFMLLAIVAPISQVDAAEPVIQEVEIVSSNANQVDGVFYIPKGEKAVVSVTATNNSTETTSEGSLSISIPELDSGSDDQLVTIISPGAGQTTVVKPRGSTIFDSNGNPITASYLLIESFGNWSAGQTKTFTFEIDLPDAITYNFQFRSTMLDESTGQFVSWPSATSQYNDGIDQQGWPVWVVPVKIELRLTDLDISGPSIVPENSGAQFNATATFHNGEQLVLTPEFFPVWTENSSIAFFFNENNGVLTTEDVVSDEGINVGVQWTKQQSGGIVSRSTEIFVEIQHIPSDLIIHSDSIDNWPLTPNQSFNYFAIVRNQGDGLALASDINVYLSNDSAISPADTPLGTKGINPLQPGQFSSEKSWGLWAPSDEGTYWIGSCVSGDPGEGDTTNNCSDGLSITVSDLTAPDLVVESPQVSTTTLTPGQNFTASATVRNQGTATSGSTTLRYKYSSNSTIDSSDPNIGSDPVSSLSAGSTSPESASVSIPTSGTFWVGACVESLPDESSTSNNCSAGVQVTVAEPTAPDLIVESPSVSDTTLTTSQNFTASATVRNQGNATSDSTTLRYRYSTNPSITGSDPELSTDFVSSLAAGATSAESASVSIAQTGTFWVGACVDPVAGESSTTNNCSMGVQVTVSEPTAPDLLVESLQVSTPTLTPGQNFTASATVRNQGTAPSASTTLRYKYSTNSTIDASDQNIGSDPVSSLASGSTSPESASVSIPETGTFWVGACVDPVSDELSTTNNCSAGVRIVSEGPDDHFVTTWQTDNPGGSGPTQVTIPMVGGPYDVDWDNDGVFDQMVLTGPVTHNFGAAGTYTVRIKGLYSSIQFGFGGDREKILAIDQWGTGAWQSMEDAFAGASNLQIPALDTPDFSAVTSMNSMFAGAASANPDTSSWDTSSVSDMTSMFSSSAANPDTSGWDTSAVTDMSGMFNNTQLANPDTSGWDTSAVTNMFAMFQDAKAANPDTSGWNTSSVTNMIAMFNDADSVNPATSNWDTSAVTNMTGMFSNAEAANPDTSNWDTSAVTSMALMFSGAESANPNTGSWNTSAVSDMAAMFLRAASANPDTSDWDTSAVTRMADMFLVATSANPDTSNWDTSAVTNMSSMFERATSANPDTTNWDTSAVTSMRGMFAGATSANPNTSNWDTSAVSDLSFMFRDAISANPDTSTWNTSSVTNMAWMFTGASAANPSTSGWDTSEVTNMQLMFRDATAANPDTSSWDTSAVTDMSEVFQGATVANPDTSAWDTSAVTSMRGMFRSAEAANPDTSGWDTSAVVNMQNMFQLAQSADPDTSGWNTSAVVNMRNMFAVAASANPETSGWNTSAVTIMENMFSGASVANPVTSGWDTSAVTNMNSMFEGAASANPDTSGWDTSEVTMMRGMFRNATSANPHTSGWDTSSVTTMRFMFRSASNANPDTSNWNIQSLQDGTSMFDLSGLTTANHESLLEAWSAQVVQPNVPFGASSNYYCSETAVAARTQLTDANQWTITDLGRGCSVSGQVSGLQGSGLTLQLNGGNDLAVAADGAFAFLGSLDNQAAYTVTVSVQPTDLSQICSVADGTGTVTGPNVTDVQVSCETNEFTVGGAVAGLSGTGIVLQNNGGDDLPISADGAFTFPTALEDGSTYDVTVATQPTDPSQPCMVTNGNGTLAGAAVTTVEIDCATDRYTVGGTVSALAATGLVLQNNGLDDLPISADGAFTFPTALADGSTYDVTVATQPIDLSQICIVTNGTGTLEGGDVVDVIVECVPAFTVSGNVSGLKLPGLALDLNGQTALLFDLDGDFTFPIGLSEGDNYTVTAPMEPRDHECTIANGTGTVGNADVVNVTVACTTDIEFAGDFETLLEDPVEL